MTKRTRTWLFILLGAVFLIGAPALIFYSQGYRFDWENRGFSQSGAFYFSVIPGRAEILVNTKSIGRTAPVLGTTLTKNFAPGTYHIQIQKEGYHSWKKRLDISAKQVTEAKHIILFPQNPNFVTLHDNVKSFWLAPNNRDVLLQKTNARNTLGLVLWDTQKNLEYPLYESSRLQDEVFEVKWAEDSNSFLLRIASKEQLQNFVQQIDRSLFENQKTVQESLQAAAQLREEHTQNPLTQNAAASLENRMELVWLDQNGILWQQAGRDMRLVALNKKPLSLKAETAYTIHSVGGEFFIQENQTLYRFIRESGAFEEFFSPFYEMVLSPDQKKLALSTGKEIWLYFLQDDQEQPFHSRGEKIFLTRFSEDVKNLTWLTAHYLMFARGNTIMVSEIDNRDHLNTTELASFPQQPRFFWQTSTKALFVHIGSQLRMSEKLLP